MKCPCCNEGKAAITSKAEEDAVLACYDCTHNLNGDEHLCGTAQAIVKKRDPKIN